ncbi:hypothetical protein [Neptunomonas japonica]|uniref:hypothetical protein n=1 Tax=Neptunomonas japonica TaxID=417574 RepID=UPI0003FB07C5|nr:hypothetical protein [Neptunomonas japonica]
MLLDRLKLLYEKKWTERVSQFGIITSLHQVVALLFKSIVRIDQQVVFFIEHSNYSRSENIESFIEFSYLKKRLMDLAFTDELIKKRLLNLIKRNNKVYLFVIDETIAGYAAVQYEGIYSFGPRGRLSIPKKCLIFNNLFVDSRFRGKSIAQKLNQSRILDLNTSDNCCVFVMKENNPALHNWNKIGLSTDMEIKQIVILSKFVKYKVSMNKNIELCNTIKDGLLINES